MSNLMYSILLALLFAAMNCACNAGVDSLSGKITGVIFDGPARPPITREMVENILAANAKWVAATPEAFTYRNNLAVKSFRRTGQWYGETIEGSLNVVRFAKEMRLRVMLKPHIAFIWDLSGWNERKHLNFDNEADRKKYFIMREEYIATLENKTRGSWRGDFEVKDPEEWGVWEKGYEAFTMECARLADSARVDLFCIGTELDKAAMQRPDFWRGLIRKIRNTYRGPLTYCANWSSYENIGFWDDLDYIGISAYFPISDERSPSFQDAMKGWKPHAVALESFQKKYLKPVLFVELGYKSIEYAGSQPWLDYTDHKPDDNAQANLYQAAFTTFWQRDWFKGIFIWKWYYAGNGGPDSYSPQNKPALEVISRWYREN
ncbi:hypothetical protein L0337_31605 [candidate division KSB1 bacterium]|nr:hypothetical protein [candidate division KSB1 bacterium]